MTVRHFGWHGAAWLSEVEGWALGRQLEAGRDVHDKVDAQKSFSPAVGSADPSYVYAFEQPQLKLGKGRIPEVDNEYSSRPPTRGGRNGRTSSRAGN